VTGIPLDFTIEVLAEMMYKTVDLLGDEETTKHIQNLTFIGSSHAKKLASYEACFFIVLGKHDKFLPLTGFMSDPHIPSKSTFRLFVMIRGGMTPAKKMVLKYALLCYLQSLVKKEYIGSDLSDPNISAQAQYQPNPLETPFKALFSDFKKEQIHYQLQKDFNGPGDFHAYWKDMMAVAAWHRPSDYTRKPNACEPDMSKRKTTSQVGRWDAGSVYFLR
jgi:hypothetical protein